ARIDEDRRQRRGDAVEPLAARAVDAFGSEPGQDAIADRLLPARSADRPSVARLPAEPGDRDRRIGGTAPAHRREFAGHGLAVGRRKLVDAKDLVEHRDAGAEDAGLTQSNGPRPRPRSG